jgi:P27 family predicted phage terminase small subunit
VAVVPAPAPIAAPAGSIEPPADLPALVHDVWRVAVAEMGGNRHLREVDLVQLKVWCEAVYVHAVASANIHRYGVLVKGAAGVPVANPMLKVQKDAAATIRQLSDVLGLSPLSRVHLGLMEIAGQSLVFDLRERLVSRLVGKG